jgi:hypothetical protein
MLAHAIPPRIVLFGLEGSLSYELKSALIALQAHLSPMPAEPGRDADLVFCAVEAEQLELAKAKYPGAPVVVVSRLPEVDAWLNALEAGAADYCAAPFEPVQMRWLLENHLPGRLTPTPGHREKAERAAA